VRDEDTELMLRVAGGDVRAFTPLVERVLPRLVAYFRRLGADASFAEDCAQETLLRVYRHRARYTARARFVTYLFHIARNHWIDVYRHRKAGPAVWSVDAAFDDEEGRRAPALEGPPRPPEADVERDELRRALEAAIADLGDEHREVFVLAQVEGLKYQEIGEILGIPVGTVKSRMHAAHRQIREALARGGFEP
jgi:RNA polymerase sigma-70 factor (ECF subfamily)